MNNITLEKMASFFRKRDGFLLICHTNPDEDTAGSAYALYLALKRMGKKVRIVCDMGPPRRGSAYWEADAFSNELGEGPYVTVSVDVAARNMLGALEAPLGGRVTLKIDHHALGEDFGDYNYTDPAAGACGMIVYRLLLLLGPLDREMASSLYLAIASDTGGFRYSNTNAETHRVAAALLDCGAEGAAISETLFETKSEKEFRALRLGLSRLRYYCEGRLALMSITNADKEAEDLSDRDLGELASLSRQTAGVLLGVVLRQSDADPKKFKISMRSREGVDAAALCASFGGGGHVRAAGGALTADSPEEAEQRLLAFLMPVLEALPADDSASSSRSVLSTEKTERTEAPSESPLRKAPFFGTAASSDGGEKERAAGGEADG